MLTISNIEKKNHIINEKFLYFNKQARLGTSLVCYTLLVYYYLLIYYCLLVN
jgi:hypothetical protein